MNDGRDTERKLFAIVLCMAILLAALTGCQGLSVNVGERRIKIPDKLALEYYRLRVRPTMPSIGADSYHDFPVAQYQPNYGPNPCAMLSGRLVRWCWANGYQDARAAIFEKSGQLMRHAQVVVDIQGIAIYLDPTWNTISAYGPKGWIHYRDAFKHEIMNVKEWQ